jgi:hypothetical protein
MAMVGAGAAAQRLAPVVTLERRNAALTISIRWITVISVRQSEWAFTAALSPAVVCVASLV